jgi:type II secretory pathway component PulF
MSPDDLAALNDEIAAMAKAGLPLDQGLAALAKDMMRGRLKFVAEDLAADLRAGRTLPEALERQGDNVPPYYAGLVTAGVRTGRVAEVLTTLSIYARSMANLRSILIGAFFYPCVVLGFALLVIGFMFGFVVPQFSQTYRDFNMRLPALTEAVFAVGRHPIGFVVIPLLVILAVALLTWFILRQTESGRLFYARALYSLPVFGTLIRSARLCAFTELLSILVDHEIPLPEAFALAGQATSDPVMAGACREIHHGLSAGLPLGIVLRGQGLIPEWVAWMAGLGEQRGGLGLSLHQISEMYRRQVEMRAGLLRSVLPPFLIIITAGVFIGFFIVALMLPMLKLLEGLAK